MSAFRQMGVGGQKYLYLLPCFQFRIIFMPKWHFLISFTGINSIRGKYSEVELKMKDAFN